MCVYGCDHLGSYNIKLDRWRKTIFLAAIITCMVHYDKYVSGLLCSPIPHSATPPEWNPSWLF